MTLRPLEAKSKLEAESAAEINAAYETLVKASHKIAEVMYQQASQNAAGGGDSASGAAAGGGSTGGGDDVIDADFVDVDDKK